MTDDARTPPPARPDPRPVPGPGTSPGQDARAGDADRERCIPYPPLFPEDDGNADDPSSIYQKV